MISPLKVYKDTAKKYGVTKELQLSPMAQLSFLETQYQEMQQILHRSLTDVLHAKRLQEDTNEVLKNKGFTNESQHVNEVQQFVGAMTMLKKFIEELKEEYQELKGE